MRLGMYAPPAAPAAPPPLPKVEFDPRKIPASIRPQPDEREDAASLPSLPFLPSLPTLPYLPSLPSLPWLTRTAKVQRENLEEKTGEYE
jgi:hypothetical protein